MARIWILVFLWFTACSTTSLEPLSESGRPLHIVWPKAPEPAKIEFVAMFDKAKDLDMNESFSKKMGRFLTGNDQRGMTRPYAIAVNTDLTTVADPGSAVVHIFDKKRKSYLQLLNAGESNFASPIGVALGGNKLYIADSELQMVFILDSRFKLKTTLEGFARPTSLAYDPGLNRLYVADTLAHEIQVFDQDGKYLYEIGSRGTQNGQFNYPSHLAFANDRLYVNDTMNFRIQIFNQDGKHLLSFGEKGNGSGFFSQPKGIAVSLGGHVYVADAMANHVQIFDQDGQFLLRFGEQGDAPGAFQLPTGLAIWNNMIYVADSYNHRVQVFKYLQEDN